MFPFPPEIMNMLCDFLSIDELDALSQTSKIYRPHFLNLMQKRTLKFDTLHRLDDWLKLYTRAEGDCRYYTPFISALDRSGLKAHEVEQLRVDVILDDDNHPLDPIQYGFVFTDMFDDLVNLKRIRIDTTPSQFSSGRPQYILNDYINGLLRPLEFRDVAVILRVALYMKFPLTIRQNSRNFVPYPASYELTSNIYLSRNWWKRMKRGLKIRKSKWAERPRYLHELVKATCFPPNSIPQSIKIVENPRMQFRSNPLEDRLLVPSPSIIGRAKNNDDNYFSIRLFNHQPPLPSYNLTSLHLEGIRLYRTLSLTPMEMIDAYSTRSCLAALLLSQRASLRSLILRDCWMPRLLPKRYAESDDTVLETWLPTLSAVALCGMPALEYCALEDLYDSDNLHGVPERALKKVERDLMNKDWFGGAVGGQEVHAKVAAQRCLGEVGAGTLGQVRMSMRSFRFPK